MQTLLVDFSVFLYNCKLCGVKDHYSVTISIAVIY